MSSFLPAATSVTPDNNYFDLTYGLASPVVVSTSLVESGDSLETLFDGDSSTSCRVDKSGTYSSVWFDFGIYSDPSQGMVGTDWAINGYAFQVASTSTPGPMRWSLYLEGIGVVEDITLATGSLHPGEWYYSTASFSTSVDGSGHTSNWRCRFNAQPSSGSYVDIAELKLLKRAVTWSDCPPPVVTPTLATPTSPKTGEMWMDRNIVPPKMKCWDGSNWNALW
jgi:hypothetical protein